MSSDDFDRLAPHLTPVEMLRGHVIIEPDQPIEHIYFLESGVGSNVAVSPKGQQVETAMFGWEGVAPIDPIMGSDRTLNRIYMQVADDAWRIGRAPFMAAFDVSPTLRSLMLRYVHSVGIQTSHTALSNAVHTIDERLARWLLMCDDRCDGEIELTHEFLAVMLAVRRPSITTALHVLEGAGLIRAGRGCISIKDRRGLEEFAADAYGKPESEYRRLIGPMR